MIKLTHGHLRDPEFMSGLQRIASFKDFKNMKVLYNISRIWAKVEQKALLLDKEFLGLVKQYAKLDEHGNLAPLNGRPGTYDITHLTPEKRAEWDEKEIEWKSTAFTIERYPLKLSEINIVGIPATELAALDDILDKKDLAEIFDQDSKPNLATLNLR